MSSTVSPIATNENREKCASQLGADRPTYDCPKCGERAMQFFETLPETPQSAERNNSYVCFACGRTWEM